MQIISLIIKFIAAQLISFYSLSANDIDGNPINFSSFNGKKVLIVNTCTACADTVQYRQLEMLHQKYASSLVIIAFPSDDFNNTPGSNSSIKSFIQTNYNTHYKLGTKTFVKGGNLSPLYSWLSDIKKNAMMKSKVKKDFFKYLINEEGILIGIFNSKVDPMSNIMQQAIEMP